MWSKFAIGQFGGPFIKEESFTFHHIRSFKVMQKKPENYD